MVGQWSEADCSGDSVSRLAARAPAPLTEYYASQGKLEQVDGMQSEASVFAAIKGVRCQALRALREMADTNGAVDRNLDR